MKKVLSFLIYSPPWVHQELIHKKGIIMYKVKEYYYRIHWLVFNVIIWNYIQKPLIKLTIKLKSLTN